MKNNYLLNNLLSFFLPRWTCIFIIAENQNNFKLLSFNYVNFATKFKFKFSNLVNFYIPYPINFAPYSAI